MKNILILILCCFVFSANSTILELSTNKNEVLVNESFWIDVQISNLDNNTAISAYDLDLDFDNTLFSVKDFAFGTNLDIFGFGTLLSFAPIAEDTLNIFELSFDFADDLIANQANSFTLFSVQFEALQLGFNGIFGLSINALGDHNGDPLSPAIVNTSLDVVAPSVKVSSPSVIALSMIGLIILVMFGNRHGNRQA
jgi:hypothetical protein